MRAKTTTAIPAMTAILVGLALAGPVSADLQHPNIERGIPPEKAFQFGDLDTVNLFNGNLGVSIPIGGDHPIGANLAYRLTLIYNSKLYDWETVCYTDNGFPVCAPQARANMDSNAGFGWLLSLGQLVAPQTFPRNPSSRWLYIGPDGSEHELFDSLHLGDPVVANVFYSRDNTYLRMKRAGARWDIEFPDGTIHRFRMVGSFGHVISIRDRLGNQLTVTYPTALQWNLSDGHRTHVIKFKNRLHDGVSIPTVDTVDLAAHGGARAVYSFTYAQRAVPRPCPFAELPPEHPLHIGSNATVDFLTAVNLPDGSKFNLPVGASYHLDQSAGCRTPGVIKKLQLPTLGSIAWQWGTYTFPTGEEPPPPVSTTLGSGLVKGGPVPDPPFPEWLRLTIGVTRRQVLRANNTVAGQWTYAQTLTVPPPPPGGGVRDQPVESRTVVTDPLGHKSTHFFSALLGDGPTDHPDARKIHYGLPFTVKQNDGTNPKRYLSRQVRNAANQLLRSVYLRYEWDKPDRAGSSPGTFEPGKEWKSNRRRASDRTTYHDDGNRWTAVDLSSFDGLGHYR